MLGLEPPDPLRAGGSGREQRGGGGPVRHSGTRGCFRAPRSFSPPQPPSSPSRGMESWLPAGPPPPPSSPRDPARPSPQCLPQAVPPLSHTRSPCAPPAAWFAPAYLQAPSLHPPGGTAVPAPAASGWGGSHSLRFVFPLRLPSPAPPPPPDLGAVGLFRKAGRSSTLNRWISHVFGHFRPNWRKLPK